ncbi:hypothetical protein Tco_0449763 [Tanacetum coccineum]
MASGGCDRNAEYELSKLLQMGTVAEYQDEFEKLINRGSLDAVRYGIDEVSSARLTEVVMGGGEALGVYREKCRGIAEGGRRVLCYVQGNKRLKKKKMEAAIQRRLWDPGIKSAFQDNTLRARWF